MAAKQIRVLWLVTGLITLGGIVIAAATGNKALSGSATAIFAVTSIVLGWLLNSGATTAKDSTDAVFAAQDNALMMAGAFGWGGTAILSGYYLTSLFWHHAWQYGGAMVIIAASLLFYVRLLGVSTSRLRSGQMLRVAATLAAGQACAATTGLAFLIWSEKLGTDKPDWLANHVFLGGGTTIAALSLFSIWAQYRVSNRPET